MAYERLSTEEKNQTRGDSLDSFVSGMMQLYGNQIAVRNAEEENNFNKAIVDNGLSLDEQLDYRKEQLKRVGDDPAERKRLNAEITNLTARVEQYGFAEDYQGKVADIATGISSIDSTIQWLNDRLDATSDPDTRLAIEKAISNQEDTKFTLTQNLLKNQTDYAVNDKSASIVDAQITRVTAAKNKAMLSGDNLSASSYDLQLQALNKAKNENSIQSDINNLAVATVTGASSATALLDAFNNKITASSPTGSVKIGDVTYPSAQAFWTFKRDSYLADNSSSGFFSRYNTEQNNSIKVKNSQNSLSVQDLKNSSSSYDNLLTRPELANYSQNIAVYKQDSLQTGANLLANTIVNDYNKSYDLNAAVTALNNIKSAGVNVDDSVTKILQNSATLKSSQLGNILQAAQNLMLNDPALAPMDAVNKAIASGAGGTVSPNQFATKPVETIAKETTAAASAGSFGAAPATQTVAPTDVAPTAPIPSVVPTPVAPVNNTSAVPAVVNPAPAVKIDRQLSFGMTDPAVKELQKFLNSQGFAVAASGEGSTGNETNYFGPLTQAALQKFQAAKGIVSSGDAATTGYGRLGPQTLTAIGKILGY